MKHGFRRIRRSYLGFFGPKGLAGAIGDLVSWLKGENSEPALVILGGILIGVVLLGEAYGLLGVVIATATLVALLISVGVIADRSVKKQQQERRSRQRQHLADEESSVKPVPKPPTISDHKFGTSEPKAQSMRAKRLAKRIGIGG